MEVRAQKIRASPVPQTASLWEVRGHFLFVRVTAESGGSAADRGRNKEEADDTATSVHHTSTNMFPSP